MYETLGPLTERLESLRMALLDMGVGKPLPPPTRMLRLVQDIIDDLNTVKDDVQIEETQNRDYDAFIRDQVQEDEGRRHNVVYLAGPYSHPDAAVREARARHLTEIAAGLTRNLGLSVISPITMGHPYALAAPDLPLPRNCR